jgi:hypothetical protein
MNAPLSAPPDVAEAECLLQAGWTIEEIVDDCVTVDSLDIHRCGITARSPAGAAVTGSAATLHASASVRAWFELIERASILSSSVAAPGDGNRVPSRSNGVALARGWNDACHRARRELAERDRVLRCWQLRPESLEAPPGLLPQLRDYTWRLARMPGERLWSADLDVVVAIAFPRDDTRPLLRGFGAGVGSMTALHHAVGECIQALAFLASDDVPTDEPVPTPTPLFHLDRYLWPPAHATLRAWLDGQFDVGSPPETGSRHAPTTYTDITPPWAHGRFRVARASCSAAYPLVFGPPLDPTAFPHPIP